MVKRFEIPVLFMGKKYIWYKAYGTWGGPLVLYSFYDEESKKLKPEAFDPTTKSGIKDGAWFARVHLGGEIKKDAKVIGHIDGLVNF